MQHTLLWGKLVATKHGDHIGSWPRIARNAATAAIERAKRHLEEKEGSVTELARRTSCREHERGDGYALLIEVDIETAGR